MKPINSPLDVLLVSPNLIMPLAPDYYGVYPQTVSTPPEDCLSYTRMAVTYRGTVLTGSSTTLQLKLQERAGTSGGYATFYTGTAISDGSVSAYLLEIDLSKRLRYIRAQIIISGTPLVGELAELHAILTGRTMGRVRDLQSVVPVRI